MLQPVLSSITGIDSTVLADVKKVHTVSISQRMAWASQRETRRGEDRAYSLIGIFRVQVPALYGEGQESAFRRLQEEIVRNSDDHSIFARVDPDPDYHSSGLLTPSPRCYKLWGAYSQAGTESSGRPYAITNKGLSIDLCLIELDQNNYVAALDCDVDQDHYVGLDLERTSPWSQEYRRVRTHELCRVRKDKVGTLRSIFVNQFDL